MIYQTVLRRAPLLAVVLAVVLAVALAAVVATATIAAAMHGVGDVTMVDALPAPRMTTFVPILQDGPPPHPTL